MSLCGQKTEPMSIEGGVVRRSYPCVVDHGGEPPLFSTDGTELERHRAFVPVTWETPKRADARSL